MNRETMLSTINRLFFYGIRYFPLKTKGAKDYGAREAVMR